MTTAFDDQILERRDRRKRRSARVRHAVGRALVPLAWFAGTLLVLCVIVGFSEARATYGSRFDWPGAWLGRAWGSEGTRPVLPFSGALLTLFCGSWLSYAGIRLLRRALRYGSGMMAIARNVVEEAVRNKIVLLLLGLLLLALAWWPWSLLSASNPQPLRYQVQGFLSFSTMVSGLLLGAVTILFGAYSVGGDIQINRTGDVFVKPLSRVGYLVGKWLGVVMLMGVILLVQGLVVWGVARHWMGQNYLTDEEDWTTVNQRVLVAREAEYPMPARSFEDIADEQLAAEVQGQTELLNRRGAANLRNDFLNGERQKFLTVQPRETNTYVFDGLSLAKRQATAAQEAIAKDAARIVGELDALGVGGVRPEDLSLEIFAANPLLATRVGVDVRGAMLQFRFKIEGTNTFGDKTRAFHLKLNGRLVNGSRPIAGPIDAVQVYDVPATYVDDAGRLSVEVVNDVPAAAGAAEAPRLDTLEFDPATWLTLYHITGGFEANLARGVLLQWARLMFLAMLGVVSASLMTYPVAAVLSLSIWTLAAGGEWLRSTLSYRVVETDVAAVDGLFNRLAFPAIRSVASVFSQYSRIDVGQRLVDGLSIGYGEMLVTIAWVVVVWTGVTIAFGGYLFGRREIARVQV